MDFPKSTESHLICRSISKMTNKKQSFSTNKQTGNYGEQLACQYLQRLGYKILERNFRIRGGEIDIIARDKDTLVFVEVKTRYSKDYGNPLESITPWKIKHLIRTSKFYTLKNKLFNTPLRIDAVSVDLTDGENIELTQNIAQE